GLGLALGAVEVALEVVERHVGGRGARQETAEPGAEVVEGVEADGLGGGLEVLLGGGGGAHAPGVQERSGRSGGFQGVAKLVKLHGAVRERMRRVAGRPGQPGASGLRAVTVCAGMTKRK